MLKIRSIFSGVARIFRVDKTLAFSERLVNEGAEPMDLMWGHHPAFGPPFLDESCVIDLPGATVQTVSLGETSRCQPGPGFTWPLVSGCDGEMIDLSRIPSAEAKSHDLAFLTKLAAGWYALTNTARRVGFGLVWPVETFRSLWFWQVFGGALGQPWYGRTYNIALEPWTTPHPTITEAIEQKTQIVLASGESLAVEFKAIAYSGLSRVSNIGSDGQVQGKN